MLTVNTSTVFG